MVKTFEKTKGFSLVETLVVIAIISIVVGVAIMNFGQARSKALLEEGQASIIDVLELAKNRAASGVGNTVTNHGVRIESDKIIIFEGSDYITGNNKATTTMPSSVLLGPSSGFDIIFGRISATSSTGTTIQITHPSGATTSVSVEKTGLISTP